MERDIRFDAVAGISAGAVFGCNYKSRQPGRAIRYNKRYSRDPRYCSLRSLIRTGDLYGADFCYRQLPDELDLFDKETFRENPMAFYVGATDVATGKPIYHQCRDSGERDMLWMRASASMPLLSRPVSVDGLQLLDGGITDAVPFRFLLEKGCERLVAVLTQPAGYRKKPCSALFPLLLRRYPETAKAMQVRHEMYNRQMDELDRLDAIVIRPPESLGIHRTEKDPEELERVYQIGRREGERRAAEVLEYLKCMSDN